MNYTEEDLEMLDRLYTRAAKLCFENDWAEQQFALSEDWQMYDRAVLYWDTRAEIRSYKYA